MHGTSRITTSSIMSFTGGLTISGGRFVLTNSATLGWSGGTTVGGGTLGNDGTNRKMNLFKKVAGTQTTLASNVTGSLNANTWYKLDFNAFSGSLTVKLNDVQKISVADTSLTVGNVVLGGYKHDILYDNVTVVP